MTDDGVWWALGAAALIGGAAGVARRRGPPEAGGRRRAPRGPEGSRQFLHLGVQWPDVATFVAYGRAIERLRPEVAWWVYRGGHKDSLMRAWAQLTQEEQAAVDHVNRQLLGDKVRLYRLMKGGQSDRLGGFSLTSDPELFAPDAVAIDVPVAAIMVHSLLPDMEPLTSPTYGYEKEVILKPGAPLPPAVGSFERLVANLAGAPDAILEDQEEDEAKLEIDGVFVWLSAQPDASVEILQLWVEPDLRSGGRGRRVLDRVITAADALRIPLVIQAGPQKQKQVDRQTGITRLERWYREAGFVGERGRLLSRPAGGARPRW